MPEALRVASPRIAEFVDGEGVADVRRRLSEITTTQGAQAAGYSPELGRVWDVLRESLSEGKLVRPAILLAVADAVEAHEPWQREAAIELAVAVEMLHHAFLLHDDVIDHDTVRRGRPNLIARIGPELAARGATAQQQQAVGEAAGILAGDLVLSQAHERLARLDVPHATRLRLLDVLQETLQHSVAGELADVGYAARSQRLDRASAAGRPTLDDVLAMSQSKTGAYTVRLPMLWALLVAGVEPPAELEDFCQALGLAFQLQDDLLGLFGDPALVGKDPVSDLREGKFTAVMAYASLSEQWAEIEPDLGREDLGLDDGVRILALLEASGARTAVERDLADALARAHGLAADSGRLAGVLDAIVLALTERRS
ncbi:geranylgeranyl pyrophosphate synthase [Serinibacter arcticus]|uniref:Geranylgeranyl pyrophosphate synthase n=1 Tax=Serinibacter arcticus TaxID=1655435 RepID=A0A2U1ZVJ4_9MICO|nr:polyprenyl synthetase family protein [Serinibacter arcticus]PWD51006.1 geranylgeranyl pyrophosphate synthase [Serinibacter arcticus]